MDSSSVCTSYKVELIELCLFVCSSASVIARMTRQRNLVGLKMKTVTIHFLPRFVHAPYGEREENGKRKKKVLPLFSMHISFASLFVFISL